MTPPHEIARWTSRSSTDRRRLSYRSSSGAANRYPDQCEADRVGSRVINVEACGRLAAYCQRHSILLIYISSDYVFSGRPGEAPYTTSSTPEPANFYGQTKLEGERVTLSTMTESGLGLVLRVPVLYGECIESRSESAINILADLVWKSQTKLHGDKTDDDDPIQVDDWAIRYPTNTEDVARVIEDLARRYLLDRTDERTTDRPHLLQFSSEEAYTKYGICRIMADILGVSIHGLIVPHRPRDEGEQEDDDVVVKRAYDCHLSTQALKDLGMDVHTQNFVHWWFVPLSLFFSFPLPFSLGLSVCIEVECQIFFFSIHSSFHSFAR